MTFAEKLTTLMNIYRLPNIAIARGIGIDPSLVSRWKTGQREPADGEETATALADYFAQAPLLVHDRILLTQTLGGASLDSQEALTAALTRWLSGRAASQPSIGSASDTLLWDGFMQLFAHPRALSSPGPINLWPRVQKGAPFNHEGFTGHAGRRQAAINFFHLVLSGGKRHHVGLLLSSDVTWITEDPAFAVLWEKTLRAMVVQGCHVTMIHPAPDSATAFLSLLNAYWPLYQTGRFVSRLMPSARAQPDQPTLFASDGVAAMVSYFSDQPKLKATTLLFQNAPDSRLYSNLFNVLAEQAVPLAHVSARETLSTPVVWSDAPYATVAPHPGSLWVPEEVAARCLPRPAPGQPPLAERQKAFLAYLEGGGQWLELWPATWFEDIKAAAAQRQIEFTVSSDEWGGGEVRLTGEDARITLLYMSNLLRKYTGLKAACVTLPATGLRIVRKSAGELLFLPAEEEITFHLEYLEALSYFNDIFDRLEQTGSDAIITHIARLLAWMKSLEDV